MLLQAHPSRNRILDFASSRQARVIAGSIVLGVILVSYYRHSFKPVVGRLVTFTPYNSDGKANAHARIEDVFNSTLGFSKLYAINLPERSDHRDAVTLSAALTDLHFTFVDGIHGDTIPDKALPPGREVVQPIGSRGSWRAHMNAIRSIIDENLGSALIVEDDLDWDIRIKTQMRDFAEAARALLQPLKSDHTKHADPKFPVVQDANLEPEGMVLGNLPHTIPPALSPYSDDWDVLWLGHCGMYRPQVDLPDDLGSVASQTARGIVVHFDDETVPEPQYLMTFGNGAHQRLQTDFPPHTRLVHHTLEGICSVAYAVSQRGARKILHELALEKFDDNFDIELREFCDGTYGRTKHTCLTVQPTLFDHHRPVGPISHESDLTDLGGGTRDKAFTNNIRFSTRMNLEKLINGQTDYDDQWPDTK